MVYYFKSRCGQYTIYMGKEKMENEELIKYGLDIDVWFHVDSLSSAHGMFFSPIGKSQRYNTKLILDHSFYLIVFFIYDSVSADEPWHDTR